MSASRILVVDDEPDIRDLVREILEDEGYRVDVAQSAAEARARCRDHRPDLVLLDIWMPGEDGVSLLKDWNRTGGLPAPVIMISGHGTVDTAVEATRLGAYDFVEKPLSLAKLLLTVSRALHAERLERENVDLRREVLHAVEPVGGSPLLQALREQCRRIAQHDAGALVSGEPGAGKETFVRYLHGLGPRRERPFVAVSAATLSHESGAAELFGAERGEQTHRGLLEQADGGVLLLREVGELDTQLQARLQNALESGQYLRVGGAQPVGVSARVMATTSQDLAAAARAGDFREDLYYRLSVVTLQVPPLREHAEDVSELLSYYVNLFNVQQGLPYREFSFAAQNFLRHHPWPGNVRELYNLVQRVMIMGTSVEVDLSEVQASVGNAVGEPTATIAASLYDLPLREARDRFERDYLLHQLQAVGGNVSKLAERVGMERTHLYRKMRALAIDPKQIG